jgi:hypothetical protein
VSYKQFELKRAVLCPTRLQIFFSITCSLCNGRLGTSLYSLEHFKSTNISFISGHTDQAQAFLPYCRITGVSYKVFFDSIEAQGRALLRIPLVRLPFASSSHPITNKSHRTSTIPLCPLHTSSLTTPSSCVKSRKSTIRPFLATGQRQAQDSAVS